MALNPTGLRFVVTANSATPAAFTDEQWAISGPRADGADIVLFSVPAGSAGAVTDIQYSVNDGPWLSLGGTVAGLYPIVGLTVETAYRVQIRAVNVAGAEAPISTKALFTLPGDPRGFRGWDTQADYGTTGSIFIAPYGNDTTGSGTVGNPYRTLTKAVSVATSAQTIRARAGDYREKALLNVANLSVKGYGKEKPRFTASELLTGLVQCTAADAAVLGPVLGVNGSPVYKATKTKTGLSYTNILACTVYECGKRVMVPSDRAVPVDTLTKVGDSTTFWTADTFVVNGSNQITAIVDSSVINASRYTDAALLASKVLIRHSPNLVSAVNVTGVDLAANTITVDGLKTVQSASQADWRFAIQNVAMAMVPGTVYIVDKTTDMDIYVYPYAVENLPLLEYGVRANVLELGSADGVGLYGLVAEQATGDATYEGTNIWRGTGDTVRRTGYVLENVLTGRCDNPIDVPRSVRLAFTENAIIRNCSVWESTGRGVFLSGRFDLATERGVKNLIEKCYFNTIGGAGYLNYSQDDFVFAHNYATNTGFNDHGNLTNGYEQNNGVGWWGNEFGPACNGYLTWQEATDVFVAFNHIPQLSKTGQDYRAIADQNHDTITPPPHANGFAYIFNNTITPDPNNNYAAGLSVDIDSQTSDLVYTAANNVVHGISNASDMSVPPAQIGYNVITRLDAGNGQVAGDFDSTNVVQTNLSLVYTDAPTGNFTPVAASPILTMLGQDKSATVAALTARFTQFTAWDKDYANQTIEWSDLPVGADASLNWVRP